MNTRSIIQEYVCTPLAGHNYHGSVSDTNSLILSGHLYSVAVVSIAVFLEQTFSIEFSDFFDQIQFDSIESILNFSPGNGVGLYHE